MPGPYEGLKVIEFGRFIAAPYCGQMLADGGADVIKIEPLTGDDARHNGTRLSPTEARQFVNKNRGKRSVALQLSDDRVAGAVRKLAESADVIISNFRPGQADKLGLDYAGIAAANPRVIYAENSAFGLKGPLGKKPGMDVLLQGHTGLAEMTREGPKKSVDPLVDYTAALLLSWGIATALYHRERTGVGQRLDVSLLQAALVIQNNSINHIDKVDGWRDEFVEYLKAAFQRGESLETILAHRASLKPPIEPPYYGFFKTRDGYIAIAAGGRRLGARMATLLDIDDPAHGNAAFQPDNVAEYTRGLRSQTTAALERQTTAHWLEIFDKEDVPACAVQFKDQVINDPQSWQNEYLVRIEHEEVGGMTVVAPPVKFSESKLAVKGPSPVLGRHTREVLTEAGLSLGEIDALISDNVIYQHKRP